MATTEITATLFIDSETYVQRGASRPGMNCRQWADEFFRLGGEQCRIRRPHGLADGVAPRAMHLHFAGTADALEFVLGSVRPVLAV